jgi:hypothetical protein
LAASSTFHHSLPSNFLHSPQCCLECIFVGVHQNLIHLGKCVNPKCQFVVLHQCRMLLPLRHWMLCGIIEEENNFQHPSPSTLHAFQIGPWLN